MDFKLLKRAQIYIQIYGKTTWLKNKLEATIN